MNIGSLIGIWLVLGELCRVLKCRAFRDIHCLNIMMDPRPLVSEMYHPKNPRKSYDFRRNVSWVTRTAAPTKYYYVDFGISCQYPADCVHPLEYRTWGGDRSVPEFQRSEGPFDPFPTDIYYLGSVIREEFTSVRLPTSPNFCLRLTLLSEMLRI